MAEDRRVQITKIEGKVNTLESELNNMKVWSNEKDLELEKQFLSLKESQDRMCKHYDTRMDKMSTRMDELNNQISDVAKTQVEMRGEIKGINKNFSLLLRLVAGGILSGLGIFIFKIVWDIVSK